MAVQEHGRFVVHEFAYDGGRRVTVYVPPGPPEAIVFAGDGQRLARWGSGLEGTALASTMIVGVHGQTDETLRLQEYSLGLDPARFAAHERFFVEEVRQWTAASFGVWLPRERTAVLGVSAGGEMALAMGLRHPEVYGAILCASPGAGYTPPAAMPRPLPRVYLVAGTEEPFFRANAARWEEALRGAGAEVVMSVRAGRHGGGFWQAELPLMLQCAFGLGSEPSHLLE